MAPVQEFLGQSPGGANVEDQLLSLQTDGGNGGCHKMEAKKQV